MRLQASRGPTADATVVRSPSSSPRISVVDVTFALWACVIPFLFAGRLLSRDGDLARHIVTGRHILREGPRFADVFSFSRAGEPFLAYEWLSQSIFALTDRAAGLPGIAVLCGFLMAATLALVVRYVRDADGDPWFAFIVGIAAAALTGVHWIARPHLFTYLALALLANVLRSPRRTLLVVPLFAVWANLHPGFLYGLVMLALWGLGTIIEDVRDGRALSSVAVARLAPIAAAAVATLLNPFGWDLHAHTFELLGSGTVQVVQEFLPLDVLHPFSLLFLGVCGLIVFALAAQREWVGTHVVLIFGAAVFAALVSRRNAPVFAVFALPLVAHALTPLVRALPAWFAGNMRAEFARGAARRSVAGPIAIALVSIVLAADGRVWPRTVFPATFDARTFPEAAVREARAQRLEGRLLSAYMWGGYVLYSWPGQRVFIDSMADFFGEELITEYRYMEAAAGDWQRMMESHDFRLVLFPPDAPIVTALRRSTDWHVIHADDVSVLLQRVAPASDGAPTS